MKKIDTIQKLKRLYPSDIKQISIDINNNVDYAKELFSLYKNYVSGISKVDGAATDELLAVTLKLDTAGLWQKIESIDVDSFVGNTSIEKIKRRIISEALGIEYKSENTSRTLTVNANKVSGKTVDAVILSDVKVSEVDIQELVDRINKRNMKKVASKRAIAKRVAAKSGVRADSLRVNNNIKYYNKVIYHGRTLASVLLVEDAVKDNNFLGKSRRYRHRWPKLAVKSEIKDDDEAIVVVNVSSAEKAR
jgi:hypothetical protein